MASRNLLPPLHSHDFFVVRSLAVIVVDPSQLQGGGVTGLKDCECVVLLFWGAVTHCL